MMTFEPRIDQEAPRKQSRQNDDQTTNCFDQLPHQVMVDILSRLPITSLLQFSFVSRSLNSLCHDPHVANAHSSRSGSSVLILHSDYPIQNQLHFLQISHGKCRRIDAPFASWMPEFSILGSSNGLLCLINSFFADSIYFYNPLRSNVWENRRWVSCHLATLYGCLCAAIPAAQGLGALEIWVMKEYGVAESWTKAYSIRGYYPVSMISHQLPHLEEHVPL